jgi:hypothetical protein
MKRGQGQRRADSVQMRNPGSPIAAARPRRPDNGNPTKDSPYPPDAEAARTSRREKEQPDGYATGKGIRRPGEPTGIRDRKPAPCRQPHTCPTGTTGE